MKEAEKDLIIGFSTGFLYEKDIYRLSLQENILRKSGANCVEISMDLGFWKPDDERFFSLKCGEIFDGRFFKYRSLHFPVLSEKLMIGTQISRIKEAISFQRLDVVLVHPLKTGGRYGEYPVNNYKEIISSGIPLAIENMDSKKDSGFEITELEWLARNIGLRFVLDAQHAYEHDKDMGYAKDLFRSLRKHLVHLHLSGETEKNIHSLVYKSKNQKAIIDFAKMVLSKKNMPIILEGKFKNPKELKKEIIFLKKELISEL